jgi:hypothetical protein
LLCSQASPTFSCTRSGLVRGDSALISGVTFGFMVTSGGTTMSYYGNRTINQGTETDDIAAVQNSSYMG